MFNRWVRFTTKRSRPQIPSNANLYCLKSKLTLINKKSPASGLFTEVLTKRPVCFLAQKLIDLTLSSSYQTNVTSDNQLAYLLRASRSLFKLRGVRRPHRTEARKGAYLLLRLGTASSFFSSLQKILLTLPIRQHRRICFSLFKFFRDSQSVQYALFRVIGVDCRIRGKIGVFQNLKKKTFQLTTGQTTASAANSTTENHFTSLKTKAGSVGLKIRLNSY